MIDIDSIQSNITKYRDIYNNAMFDLEDAYIIALKDIFYDIKREIINIDISKPLNFINQNGEYIRDFPDRVGIVPNSPYKSGLYIISRKGYKMYIDDLATDEISILYDYIIDSLKEDRED